MASGRMGMDPVDSRQNDHYMFSNGGYSATARLNLQYYLWGQQTGYQVHPSIPLDKENLLIADVGTGTGIWPINLSPLVPASATIHGFDLETDLLPRSEWLPSNVTWHHLDVFEPIPEDFVGKYDIVHIRFFAPVVQGGDPGPIIKNVMQLLKPGGYFQWDERDLLGMKVIGDQARAMQAIADETRSVLTQFGRDFNWVNKIDESFKCSDLEGVTLQRYPVPKQMMGYNQDLFFMTGEEASFGMDRMLGDGTGNKTREGIRAAYEEHRTKGSALPSDLVVCVGRKPF